MKKATLIFTLCLACMGIGSLNAEGVDIPLTDLYSVMPMDDKESNVVIVPDRGGNGFADTFCPSCYQYIFFFHDVFYFSPNPLTDSGLDCRCDCKVASYES